MLEIITRNLDTVLLIVLLAWKAFESIAPKTENKIDDQIAKGINWALQHANAVFNIVDDLSAVGLLKIGKTEAFREKLNEQYQRVYGKPLPQQAIAAAENIAAGLAAEDHNVKRLAAQINPQSAPAPLA